MRAFGHEMHARGKRRMLSQPGIQTGRGRVGAILADSRRGDCLQLVAVRTKFKQGSNSQLGEVSILAQPGAMLQRTTGDKDFFIMMPVKLLQPSLQSGIRRPSLDHQNASSEWMVRSQKGMDLVGGYDGQNDARE